MNKIKVFFVLLLISGAVGLTFILSAFKDMPDMFDCEVDTYE